MKKYIILPVALLFAGALCFNGCKTEEVTPVVDALYSLGWLQTDNVNTVPTSTNYGFNGANLPASVDLTAYFPPIGNQGKYGTCVAWATAYNMMTMVSGLKKGLNASQLASPANQFSPRDLFTAIPNNKKGGDCNGTNFESALDVLQTRGVANLQTVPYTSLSDCSTSNLQSSWAANAANNKVKYWRKIDPTVQSIKENLANNIPVLIGAKLADNFMSWNSDAVLSSNTTYNQVGQHAGHALVIAGYDDNKGAGAFKVVNSWGTAWGSRGYIWIDYNFMVNEFVQNSGGGKPVFMAATESGGGGVTPPTTNPTAGGVDLASWVFSDNSIYDGTSAHNDPTERAASYNIYNIGTTAATPASNWSIYYIYYNAYNTNDYGVIFYDDFNTTVANSTINCPTDAHCVLNYNIGAASNLVTALGWTGLQQTYYMPNISGEYYLIMLADVGDKFAEKDEENNLFYTTDEPKTFNNGQSAKGNNHTFGFQNTLQPTEQNLRNSPFRTAVNATHHNAYTPEEIKAFMAKEKKNGGLDQHIKAYLKNRKAGSGMMQATK